MFVNNDGVNIKSDDSANLVVARNVRRNRLERALSLGDLARKSGLSKQTLSKIEQGTGNPTVETLALLGHALEVPVRRLLTEWGTPVYVQRQNGVSWVDGNHGSERLLDETYGSGYVRTHLLKFERVSGQPEVIDALSLGTLHHFFLISGKMRTGPISDPVDLVAGDFVRFPGDSPHQHVCLSERAVAHVVTTVPQVRQFAPSGSNIDGLPPEASSR